MLYKPNFCCHCGEKIERIDWKLWTSRRFCAVCESENKAFDLLPRFFLAGGFILALFGVGGYLQNGKADTGNAYKTALAQQVRKPFSDAPKPGNADQTIVSTLAAKEINSPTSVSQPVAANLGMQPKTKKITSDAPVYYCGAVTRKGTPCSRKVKVKGEFCWQHSGRTASVTVKKLQAGN